MNARSDAATLATKIRAIHRMGYEGLGLDLRALPDDWREAYVKAGGFAAGQAAIDAKRDEAVADLLRKALRRERRKARKESQ